MRSMRALEGILSSGDMGNSVRPLTSNDGAARPLDERKSVTIFVFIDISFAKAVIRSSEAMFYDVSEGLSLMNVSGFGLKFGRFHDIAVYNKEYF